MAQQQLINQIQDIIQKYQNQPLDNFLIAKIELFLPKINTIKGIVFKHISSLSSAQITDFITENQAIKIKLIKNISNPSKAEIRHQQLDNQLVSNKITSIQLAHYLQQSGDKNPIHFTANPIVPGLYILQHILEFCKPNLKYFTIRFVNPLFLQNKYNIYQIAENELIGIAENIQLFHFKENNF